MKNHISAFLGILAAFLCLAPLQNARAGGLCENPGFEAADASGWARGWPGAKSGITRERDADGNHFLRITSQEPGKMQMYYREIHFPAGTEALELKYRFRLHNFRRGAQSWFDARIMMEFMDGNRQKVNGAPGAPNANRNQPEWTSVTRRFLVPENARILKFMPCLFNVNSGTFDLDDIQITPIPGAALRKEAEERAAAHAQKVASQTAQRRDRAKQELEKNGNLIYNGDFETKDGGRNAPSGWGLNDSLSWEQEDGNHFLRLTARQPDKMLMIYREYTIPAGVEAMELTWRERVSNLKVGDKPWFDARVLFKFKDADGKELSGAPGPDYLQHNTNGWSNRSRSFLVPKEAVTLVLMPTLFQTKSGIMDLDDFSLHTTDPEPLRKAEADWKRQEAARYVPPEKPNTAKFPPMLRVQGNRLVDPSGKEVWLQGVNPDGLETIPHDKQVLKSTIVAIEEWNANCLRLPINEAHWFGRSVYQNDGGKGFREIVDQVVTLAANRGAYVVIDLHRFRAPKAEHVEFWKDCAAHYKNHPAVLFDLFNEPHGISWEIWQKGGWVGDQKGKDESAFLSAEDKKRNQGFEAVGMQDLVNAVRSTGAKNIVIAGGLQWANDLTGVVNGYALEDKTGNGIMYSWHTYHWHKGWAKLLPVLKKHPVFLGEVGAEPLGVMNFIPDHEQENPYTFVPDMLGFIQKYRINWTGWCFHTKSAPRMLKDWDYNPTPYWGAFAKDALKGKQFPMKRMR